MPLPAWRPDVAEENIQARIRGNLLMALSNKFGSLVLSTGNKSEMAVGYCTLYGDMAGGLAVISDVPKTMVYELARFANSRKHRIPRGQLDQSPLRRASSKSNRSGQPSALRCARPHLESLCRGPSQPGRDRGAFGFSLDLVRSVALQVDRNEYKRKQAPPGLKVTSKAFSVGRRFPLAQKFSV